MYVCAEFESIVNFCPSGQDLEIRVANACHHHDSADFYKC